MNADEEIVEAEIVEDDGPAELDLVAPPSLALAPIAELRRGVLALDETRAELAALGDVTSLAFGSADIAALVGDLQALNRATRSDIAQLLIAAPRPTNKDGSPKKGKPKTIIEGLGEVSVPGGNEWKDWDSPRLLRQIIHDVIIDEDGFARPFGHPTDVGNAIAEALMEVLSFTASTSWKTGTWDKVTETWSGLRGRKIDPEDYASHTPKPALADVPKRIQS